ncbi:glucose-6-phosphate dehydrogenase, partial [bacterium]|nr:glucose-6-phosphate dehydrogenase [bacterium]
MKRSEVITIVIFGASGDLTRRKLIPALFQLKRQQLLPKTTHIVGFARRPKSNEAFRDEMRQALADFSRSKPTLESTEVKEFADTLSYHSADYDSAQGYAGLRTILNRIDTEHNIEAGTSNRLFYLSTPPGVFSMIVKKLGASEIIADPLDDSRWTRVIIEKPFGHDLESARALNDEIHSVLDESQIYRIDHYLGK